MEERATERPRRRSTVVSPSVVKQSAARHRHCSQHWTTVCHVFTNGTAFFPNFFFFISTDHRVHIIHTDDEEQLVTRVGRGVRRRGAGPGLRTAAATRHCRPVRDAGQRSEDRVHVHVGRMRAQVQDQRHAHHALHRQAVGRHQVRFEVSGYCRVFSFTYRSSTRLTSSEYLVKYRKRKTTHHIDG